MSTDGATADDESGAAAYTDFHELVRTLRQRCPWDIQQTHDSLVPYLVEETYEVVDAIAALDSGSPRTDADLVEELGDLWYQVEFHAAIAEQQGRFTMADVVRGIHDKLVRRHPHVFLSSSDGSAEVADLAAADDISDNWDAIKRAEKPDRSSIFDGVPKSLPSIPYAAQVQSKAAKVGFDWSDPESSAAKVNEELDEVQSAAASADSDAIADEIGDLLFAVVNLARHHRVDPDSALRAATNKFRARFEHIERAVAGGELSALSDDQLTELWAAAKRATDRPDGGTPAADSPR